MEIRCVPALRQDSSDKEDESGGGGDEEGLAREEEVEWQPPGEIVECIYLYARNLKKKKEK